jgi:hypothetical protein
MKLFYQVLPNIDNLFVECSLQAKKMPAFSSADIRIIDPGLHLR